MSRFYGVNLFLKILIDKFLSLIFLLIASPLLIFSALAIYIEDGFPIFLLKIEQVGMEEDLKFINLRSLKKLSFDRTLQVTKDDKRLLKIGKFIRRYSIDELPLNF